VRHIKLESFFLQDFASFNGFADSLWRQLNVVPTSELVLKVPLALTMAHEHYLVQVFRSFDKA
jgi:hypothetical protein